MKRVKFLVLQVLGTASALALAMVTTATSPAWAGSREGDFHNWDGYWGGGHMIFGFLMMILFIGVIVALVVASVRWLGGRQGNQAPERSRALHILEERFARGEIDSGEFAERKKELS